MVRPEALIGAACLLLLGACSNEQGPAEAVVDTPGPATSADLIAWTNTGAAPFVMDVRPLASYRHGHIPGAVQVWRDAYTRTDLPFTGMAATRENVRALLDSLGLRPDQKVVAYDDRGGCEAARLWWLLKVYGHPNVTILDGGYQGWQAEGHPVDLGWVHTSPSGYTFPNSPDSSMVATLADVKDAALAHHGKVLDTRSSEEFTGAEMKQGAFRAGAIPGSLPYDWGNAIDYDHHMCLRDTASLKHQFTALGIQPSDTVIAYCHSGVRSAHTTFVLTQVLGMKNVRSYDGSWTEWSYHEDLPIKRDTLIAPLPN